MAGGSLPALSDTIDKAILKAATDMRPIVSYNKNEYILSDGKKSIVYNVDTKMLVLQ